MFNDDRGMFNEGAPITNAKFGEFKLEMQQAVNMQIEGHINAKFKEVEQRINQDITGRIQSNIKYQCQAKFDEAFDAALTESMQQRIRVEMADFYKKIESKVDHYFSLLKEYRSFLQVDQFKAKIALIAQDVFKANQLAREAIVKSDRLVQNIPAHLLNDYTDDEIKQMFIDSGAQLKDVATRFNVEPPMASKYVNGIIKGKEKREMIYHFLSSFKDLKEENLAASELVSHG